MRENKCIYEIIRDWLNKIYCIFMMEYYEIIKNNIVEYYRYGKMFIVFCYVKIQGF